MTGEESAIQTQWSEDRDAGVAATCPSFDTLSTYFDGELPEVEMRSIRSHLATCPRCAPVIADFRSINSLLNDEQLYALPRSFALTEEMAAQPGAVTRSFIPVAPLSRVAGSARSVPLFPILTAIAALLLIAVISGEAWTGGGSSSTPGGETARTIIIDGVPVEVDDDATFGAASAGAMNNAESSASAEASSKTSSSNAGDSRDWFNWWRPFEAVLGLTVVALIVTMMSRRRPRHS